MRVGLELFNQDRFFDAHEVWEDVWRDIPRDQAARRHMQGLVQMAVAFHHWTTGNVTGSRSVLARSLRNLNGAESSLSSIDLARLRNDAEFWLRYLENATNEPPPVLPKILIRD
jgi:uncharacterized protein